MKMMTRPAVDENQAMVVAFMDAPTSSVAATFGESNLLSRIVDYLSPVDEAALTCKSFFEAASKSSESALDRIEETHVVDPNWKLRPGQHVMDCYNPLLLSGKCSTSLATAVSVTSPSFTLAVRTEDPFEGTQ